MVVEYICLRDVQSAQGKSVGSFVMRYVVWPLVSWGRLQLTGRAPYPTAIRDNREGRSYTFGGGRPLETKSEKESEMSSCKECNECRFRINNHLEAIY